MTNLSEKTPAETLQPAQPPPNPDEIQPPQPQQLPHLNTEFTIPLNLISSTYLSNF